MENNEEIYEEPQLLLPQKTPVRVMSNIGRTQDLLLLDVCPLSLGCNLGDGQM